MATCRSCGARIFWASTEPKGDRRPKSIPLDGTDDGRPMLVPNGNLVLVDVDGRPFARYVPSGQGQHVSHFATCPHAAEHRRRR